MLNLHPLAGTSLKVSRLGLGTVKLGRTQGLKHPLMSPLPTDREFLALLEYAESLGINLLDTAPAYGLSEARLGHLLRGQRDAWVLATKVGEEFIDGTSRFDFSEAHTLHSIYRSLKRLQTDVLDLVLVHSDGQDEFIIEHTPVLETLHKLKDAGHIRAIGFSGKTKEGGLSALPLCDLLMVTHNRSYVAEQAVIEAAYGQNKGILIKKALMSGHLHDITASEALKFVFAEQGVSSLILGTLNKAHLALAAECALISP